MKLTQRTKALLGKLSLWTAATLFSALLIVAVVLAIDVLPDGEGCFFEKSEKLDSLETLYPLKADAVRANERAMSYSIMARIFLTYKLGEKDRQQLSDDETLYDVYVGQTKSYIQEIDSYLDNAKKCNSMADATKNRISEIRKNIEKITKELIDIDTFTSSDSI